MTRTVTFGAPLLCFVFSLPAVYGQGNCSIKTIVGKYAFNFTGSSTMVGGVAGDGFHWATLHAPIAGVGVYTVKPDGTADGSYWLVAGRMDTGPRLTPIPFHADLTINPDCTGVMKYTFGTYTLTEELTVLDNGNEIRSMAMQTAVPTSTWNTTSRRLVGACTQNKITGYYLFSCKSLFNADPTHIVGGTGLMRMHVAPDGSATGTYAGKFGPVYVPDYAITGKITLNSDCTAEGSLQYGSGESLARGVFFNEGKDAYWLPLLNNPGAVAQPYGYCELKQISNR